MKQLPGGRRIFLAITLPFLHQKRQLGCHDLGEEKLALQGLVP
jgi:hypothetical protein